MELILAIVIGTLYGGALYLMMRRHLVKLVVGLALLSHGANLLIFTSAGLVRGEPPIVPEGAMAPLVLTADPLPQALILTAIVISFAVLAFALILVHRVYQIARTDDLDKLTTTEQ